MHVCVYVIDYLFGQHKFEVTCGGMRKSFNAFAIGLFKAELLGLLIKAEDNDLN